MAEPILEAHEVSKRYPQRGGLFRAHHGVITAVDRVSCSLGVGETLGLVGESGSGKSTLAKLLVGLVTPTAGDVRIQGQPLGQLRGAALLQARRTVQFVFQDPTNSLNPRMTVEEILSEPLIIHRQASGASRRNRIIELLTSVQLPETYRTRLPHELSGGERQRVGIARALAIQPHALICDEPIASLDVSVGAQLLTLLRSLVRRYRMALLFISHDLRAVASLCDRITVMQHGRLVEFGSTEQILTHPTHPYTELLLHCARLDLDATE